MKNKLKSHKKFQVDIYQFELEDDYVVEILNLDDKDDKLTLAGLSAVNFLNQIRGVVEKL